MRLLVLIPFPLDSICHPRTRRNYTTAMGILGRHAPPHNSSSDYLDRLVQVDDNPDC
jgi:hypothetical protein